MTVDVSPAWAPTLTDLASDTQHDMSQRDANKVAYTLTDLQPHTGEEHRTREWCAAALTFTEVFPLHPYARTAWAAREQFTTHH